MSHTIHPISVLLLHILYVLTCVLSLAMGDFPSPQLKVEVSIHPWVFRWYTATSISSSSIAQLGQCDLVGSVFWQRSKKYFFYQADEIPPSSLEPNYKSCVWLCERVPLPAGPRLTPTIVFDQDRRNFWILAFGPLWIAEFWGAGSEIFHFWTAEFWVRSPG